jgi:hypothetical protein
MKTSTRIKIAFWRYVAIKSAKLQRIASDKALSATRHAATEYKRHDVLRALSRSMEGGES